MKLSTSRTDFNETWLTEMPSGVGSFETYDMLNYSIQDLISNGHTPTNISDTLRKIDLPSSVYYWHEKGGEILIGVELDKRPQGLVVNLTGKLPTLKGRPLYASDLYNTILNTAHSSIRILSDKQLSDEGYSMWQRMLAHGHKVSVYDRQSPGKTFQTFKTAADMEQFFAHDDTNFERYQFILSEAGQQLGETRSYFNTRRHRELAGLSVND